MRWMELEVIVIRGYYFEVIMIRKLSKKWQKFLVALVKIADINNAIGPTICEDYDGCWWKGKGKGKE